MKYMLLTYLDEKAWLALSADEQKRLMNECSPLIRKLVAEKKLLAGAPLHPTTTATTIRYRDGRRLLTDGPFAETREQLGGYTIIEAKDLDEAIAIASGIVGTSTIPSIEVRPILGDDIVPPAPGAEVAR
jgi:hypothetical protein